MEAADEKLVKEKAKRQTVEDDSKVGRRVRVRWAGTEEGGVSRRAIGWA